jgi:two-component system sensor histidine kinase YesM
MSEELVERLGKNELEPKGTGIGLKNIDERIKNIFGDKYGIKVSSELNKGTIVSIKIPYEAGENNV